MTKQQLQYKTRCNKTLSKINSSNSKSFWSQKYSIIQGVFLPFLHKSFTIEQLWGSEYPPNSDHQLLLSNQLKILYWQHQREGGNSQNIRKKHTNQTKMQNSKKCDEPIPIKFIMNRNVSKIIPGRRLA